MKVAVAFLCDHLFGVTPLSIYHCGGARESPIRNAMMLQSTVPASTWASTLHLVGKTQGRGRMKTLLFLRDAFA